VGDGLLYSKRRAVQTTLGIVRGASRAGGGRTAFFGSWQGGSDRV
jgi:hypothetical protein